jgi:hypothetical protein
MNKNDLLDIINKYVEYAEPEIYDAVDKYLETMYSYDELRQIAYNAYCLGQLEEPTENKYNLWIQQFKKK